MTQPDPATSARDIHTVSDEYQAADAARVEDLYWHLVGRDGRGISIDDARDYIGGLTARFRREILRSWLDHLALGPVTPNDCRSGAERSSLPAPRSPAMLRRYAASAGTERALAAQRELSAEDNL